MTLVTNGINWLIQINLLNANNSLNTSILTISIETTQKWMERTTISIRNDRRYLFSNSVRVNLAAFSYVESVSTLRG